MRGCFLDLDSIHPDDLSLEALESCLETWQFYRTTDRTQLHDRITDAEVIVTNKVVLDRQALTAATQLKLVCVAATGTNNIDLEAAGEAGIAVCNARDYATASVTEAVFCMMLSLTRHLDRYRQRVADGDWTESPHFCLFDRSIGELGGKTLGIIGYGVLGKAVERMAKAFSMKTLIAQRLHGSPLAGRTPLDTLLRESDVISLHCPLTDETKNLIGRSELQAMKRHAILINTARGGIVNETALAEALQSGWIGGAGLDVLAEEPPQARHALLTLRSPHLIVTPHIAWGSHAARQQLLDEIVANIRAFRSGEVRNRVNPA